MLRFSLFAHLSSRLGKGRNVHAIPAARLIISKTDRRLRSPRSGGLVPLSGRGMEWWDDLYEVSFIYTQRYVYIYIYIYRCVCIYIYI